jgi:hypothetical protein
MPELKRESRDIAGGGRHNPCFTEEFSRYDDSQSDVNHQQLLRGSNMSLQRPGFVKLVDVLYQYKSHPDVVVKGIEDFGIWTCEFNRTMRTQHPVQSQFVLEALVVTHEFIEDQEGGFSFFDTPDEFEDAFCPRTYGWPAASAPDFQELLAWLHPPLITLDRILFQKQAKYNLDFIDLAMEIERNGVYGYKKFPSVIKHSANSAQAQEAITALSVYMADANSDNPHHELYSPEEDPTCMYGWPEDNFPRFRGPSDEERPEWLEALHQIKNRCRRAFFREDLYTIGRILATNKATPAVIQTAIETFGVYGYDALGRVEFHKPESNPAERARHIGDLEDALVEFARPLMKQGYPNYEVFDLDAFAMYGWPHDKLPDFRFIASTMTVRDSSKVTSIPSAPRAQEILTPEEPVNGSSAVGQAEVEGLGAAKEGYDLLVLGLLAFINGEYPAQPNTDPYTKQNDLIKILQVHMGETYGLGSTSIRKKFGAANALRPRVNLPPLNKASRTDHLHRAHQQLNDNPRTRYAADDDDENPSRTLPPISGGTF